MTIAAETSSPRAASETLSEAAVDVLGSQIVGLAGRVAAATCRWLLLVAEFDACEGYARSNLASTARWLSHSCGISHRTAVDHVRVARALAAFPVLASALQAGRISYCHARAIARVADPGEDRTVADLIGLAEHGTVGQLETVVRGLRTVEDSADDDGADAPRNGEYVRHSWWPRTSHWRMSARLDPERGQVVEHAVAAMAAAEGISHADALVRLAEIALAALNHSIDGPPRGLRGHERAAVLIHLDAADVPQRPATVVDTDPEVVVPRSRERDRPFARVDDGPGLPRAVVERLLCACRVRPVVHDSDGSVLDLGRSKRVVDDRQFRALLLRDRHCAHPGCTSRHRLEAHHVVHWLQGGRTDMANLVLLCEVHHHKHHDGEFAIHRVGSSRRGCFVFTRADGGELPAHLDPSTFIDPALPPIESEFLQIPDAAIRSKSVGDRLDRAWAVAVLAARRQDDLRGRDRLRAA